MPSENSDQNAQMFMSKGMFSNVVTYVTGNTVASKFQYFGHAVKQHAQNIEILRQKSIVCIN